MRERVNGKKREKKRKIGPNSSPLEVTPPPPPKKKGEGLTGEGIYSGLDSTQG